MSSTSSPSSPSRRISKCPALRDLQLKVAEGFCLFCKEALHRAGALVCRRAECLRNYQRIYHAWLRTMLNEQGLTQRGKRRKNKTWVGRTT